MNESEPRTACPFCAESIQVEAKRCPHCGEWIDPTAAPGPAARVTGLDAAEIKKFKDQMNALGGVNVLVAILVGALAITTMAQKALPVAIVVGGFAATLLVLGVFLFLKHTWAAMVSLVFYLLFLVGNLIQFNVCGLIIFGACILQSIRVAAMDRNLRSRGIDPTA